MGQAAQRPGFTPDEALTSFRRVPLTATSPSDSSLVVEVEALRLNDRGVAECERKGLRLLVPGLLPSERALVQVVRVSPHRVDGRHVAWGALIERLTDAPERTATPCPAFGRCADCSLQHLPYSRQLVLKSSLVKRALAEEPDTRNLAAEDCRPSPVREAFRCNASFSVERDRQGRTIVAPVRPLWGDTTDAAACTLNDPAIVRAAVATRELLARPGNADAADAICHLAFRCNRAGQVVVVLGVVANVAPARRLAKLIVDAASAVAVLGRFSGAEDDDTFLLAGDGPVLDPIEGVSIDVVAAKHRPNNAPATAELHRELRGRLAGLGPLRRAVHLGVAAGASALATRALASEVVLDAEAANALGFKTAEQRARLPEGLRVARASEAIALLGLPSTDVAVFASLRGAARRAAMEAATSRGPKWLVLIEPDPRNLARELGRLIRSGYRVRGPAISVDLQPHSARVTAMAVLER